MPQVRLGGTWAPKRWGFLDFLYAALDATAWCCFFLGKPHEVWWEPPSNTGNPGVAPTTALNCPSS